MIFSFLFVFGIHFVHKEPFLDYTLSPDGIQKLQSNTSKSFQKFCKILCDFGGGKELVAACLVSFIWGRRSKTVYYAAMLGIDKVYVNYFKLLLAQPRPYMINPDIVPISCSKQFGQPSGHSSAAQFIGILLVLDVFHGSTRKNYKEKFYPNWFYYLCLFLAISWAIMIPFSRFLLGVHSLDQIVFGVTLGIWAGFNLHFVVRDHLIDHIENALAAQDLTRMPLKELENDEKGNEEASFKPAKYCIMVFFVWAAFEILSIITFVIVNKKLGPDSPEIIEWTKNYQKSCGSLDMTYALQNACLGSCGFLTIQMCLYIFTMYRRKLICCRSGHILVQDGSTLPSKRILGGMVRILTILVLCAVFALPVLFIKLKDIPDPILIMFTNIILPIAATMFVLIGGTYDWVVTKIDEKIFN